MGSEYGLELTSPSATQSPILSPERLGGALPIHLFQMFDAMDMLVLVNSF
jgi:hypothetical protein